MEEQNDWIMALATPSGWHIPAESSPAAMKASGYMVTVAGSVNNRYLHDFMPSFIVTA